MAGSALPTITTQSMGSLELIQHGKGKQDFQSLFEKKQDLICRHHTQELEPHQCGSILWQPIKVSVRIVWSIVRCFDKPQVYKRFIQTCNVIEGDGGVGSVREIHLVSSVPATSSVERLEILNEDEHVISFRVIGGGHRLQNYSSVTSLHELEIDGCPGTLVLESYVVDIPDGNTREETHMFVDTVVRCNLKSLAQISEQQYSKECEQQKLKEKEKQQQQQPPLQKHPVMAPPLCPVLNVNEGMER
jgi:abscisic acid receptor (PYR/PYL family)